MPSVSSTPSTSQWDGDVFKRKQYANFLTKLLSSKEDEPFILNINAEWGTGKTFFLKKWHEDLGGIYPTVYFNSWKKDFVVDPLPALIAEINNRLSQLSSEIDDVGMVRDKYVKKGFKILKAAAPLLVKAVAKKYIGQDDVDDLITLTKDDEGSVVDIAAKVTETILEPFEKEEASIANFKETLSELLQYLKQETDLKLPMFIFIDELDRCRPLFAIETLEKAKHLFDIPEIKFVIATDTEQLSHSVKAIYGEGFNGRTYLRRFFSQEFSLPSPDHLDFAINLFQTFQYDCNIVIYNINIDSPRRGSLNNVVRVGANLSDIENIESIVLFALYSDLFALDLRTQQQCYERLQAICSTTPEGENLHLGYMIFLIMLKEKEPEVYNEYYSNNSSAIDMNNLNSEISSSKKYIILNNPSFAEKPHMDIKAKRLASQYFNVLTKKRDNILQGIDVERSATGPIVYKIHEDYLVLQQYKSRVDLVGRLN